MCRYGSFRRDHIQYLACSNGNWQEATLDVLSDPDVLLYMFFFSWNTEFGLFFFFFLLFFSLHVFVFIYPLPSPCLDMNKHFSSLELVSTYSVQAEALYQVFSVHSQR